MGKDTSIIDLAFVVLWVALLLSSPVFKVSAKIFGWPDFSRRPVEENRILSGRPVLRHAPVKDWGKLVDAWYNDNFAWRSDVIRFYKAFRFHVGMCPIGDLVPGRKGIVYRRNGTWPEIEDYLGAISLDVELKKGWRTLLEGRATWAEAHGAHYLEVISPVKIQVHPEYAPWTIRNFPGASSRLQLEAEMSKSFASTNIVFLESDFLAEAAKGRMLFYKEDHHVSAYGCWMLYCGIIRALRERWYPGLEPTPYFDDPPESVRGRQKAGAYTNPETLRLEVSSPGYKPCGAPEIGIPAGGAGFPTCPIRVRRSGDGLYLAMRHDSFLRFPLSTWRRDAYHELAIPFGNGFRDIAMFIFRRFSTEEMEKIVGAGIPDVIIEQIPECKISLGVFGLDETMRRAAAFGNATRMQDNAGNGDVRALALAVFDNPKPAITGAAMRAEVVDATGRVVAAEPVTAGARRAMFFGTIEGRLPFSVALRDGNATAMRLELRSAP